jgi:dephospho-CoA kinase
MMNYFICGYQGVGKDTVASMIPHCRPIALADSIRLLIRNLRINGVASAYTQAAQLLGEDNVPNDLLHILRFYSQLPRSHKERTLSQGIGTYLRECKDTVWIDEVLRSIKGNQGGYIEKSWVVTDVRRVNEAKTFADMGFKGIWVESAHDIRVQRLLDRDGNHDVTAESHVSESEIGWLREYCEATVINQGSMEELRENVGIALAYIEWIGTN